MLLSIQRVILRFLIMNLIKKLIITSLVIFSCDNIIASENLKNSNISDNQQMQNTLPINNNTVNNTDNKEWVNFLKEHKIKELMNYYTKLIMIMLKKM